MRPTERERPLNMWINQIADHSKDERVTGFRVFYGLWMFIVTVNFQLYIDYQTYWRMKARTVIMKWLVKFSTLGGCLQNDIDGVGNETRIHVGDIRMWSY